MGVGLYALVFGAFPMVRVIQDGLDGARPWTKQYWRRDGIGLYALVFGVFPMVHVIQYGLDGARPSEVVGRTTSGNIATTLGLLENLVSTTSFPPSSFDVVSLRYLALRYVLA